MGRFYGKNWDVSHIVISSYDPPFGIISIYGAITALVKTSQIYNKIKLLNVFIIQKKVTQVASLYTVLPHNFPVYFYPF